MYKAFIIFILIVVITLISTPNYADQYSFKTFTWSKALFISSATFSISSLIGGLHYQKLSDDAYNNYQNAEFEANAAGYRIVSENYNSSATYWKTLSIYSGSLALISVGLDFFIFGRIESNTTISLNYEQPGINIHSKF